MMKYIAGFMICILLVGCSKTEYTNRLQFSYSYIIDEIHYKYTLDTMEHTLALQINYEEESNKSLQLDENLHNQIESVLLDSKLLKYNGGYNPQNLYSDTQLGYKEVAINYSLFFEYDQMSHYFYFEDNSYFNQSEVKAIQKDLESIVNIIVNSNTYKELNVETQ